ncbi:anti-sigma factor family protein [Granulicella arctica]|uniref:Anti-sigma factor RsiW n=1 Tax=Granulicella arctica TaxID=940613 RepID=A0A7Y9PI36_9BACT|nr:zf-HC2 domain-containing protein [Granulicella arctica]NYF79551.1 anti-sigma factor RsiW [Granulicella arctica]
MNCRICQTEMPELLLAPASANSAAVRTHLDSCPDCQKEFASFQSTFALLDTWQAPEPSPYFDQKLAVRLREEQAMPPAGWVERMKARLLFNTGRQFRPALAGAMAVALLVGGGTFAGISTLPGHHDQVQSSAAVNDLQILDKNDQALQQMDQLLQDDQPADDNSASPPQS